MIGAADGVGAVEGIGTSVMVVIVVGVVVLVGGCGGAPVMTIRVTLRDEGVFDAFATAGVSAGGLREWAGTFAAGCARGGAEVSHVGEGFGGG